MPESVRLRAFVAPTEARAARDAARRLAEALASAGAPAPDVEVELAPSLDALEAAPGAAIAVSSMLPEVGAALRDWPATESRLTRAYEALASRDGQPLFLCTVLRHVPPELDEAARMELRLAIRRLNFLALRLSHTTGLNVADIDRALAQVGALTLGTDYRLDGAQASEAAGREIARCILAAGLDDWIPPELQERAATALGVS